jgi:hypothetical protein
MDYLPVSGLRAKGLQHQLATYSAQPVHRVLAQSEVAEAPAHPSRLPPTRSRMPRDPERLPEDVVSRIRDGTPICTAGRS